MGEYIQRHKLEKSLQLIKSGNHNILDVALSVGYDSHSSFSRAFKKVFSVTPSDVILGKLPINERAGSLPPKKRLIERQLEPVWKTLPEQTIFGLYGKGFAKQSFSSLASELYERLTAMAQPLTYSELQPIGVSIDNPWAGEQAESRFFAGFSNGLTKHCAELDSYTWESGQWACFTHTGPHHYMWQTISQVYSQWVLPNSIKLKDQQIVQLYLNNPMETEAHALKTELYFAVEKTD